MVSIETSMHHKETISTNGSLNDLYSRTNIDTLKNEVFKMIYPIGSIYVSTVAPKDDGVKCANITGTAVENVLWNGCEWKFIQDGSFLRNGRLEKPTENSFYKQFKGSGETGGSAEHTHTTDDHVLTVNEMSSHGHSYNRHNDYPSNKNGNPDGATDTSDTTTDNKRRYWRGAGGIDTSAQATTATGGGAAHNHGNTGSASNLPPYYTAYMYERVA